MNRTTPKRTSVSRLAIAGLAASCLSFTTLGRAALVSGGVLDGTTGQPLSGVQVYVDGVSTGASTDAAGKFQVDIAAGEKVLSLKKDGFIEQSLGKVEIAADGEKSLPNAKLYTKPADDVVMLDTLTVEGDLVKNSVVTARQNADVSVDLITSSDFGKFTGTDVADIIVRVPGLSTTSQGSFAVVRGLAERYNPVMLDGIVLPSSDPERQSPELDIFPSRLVDAIVISKTFEAKLPSFASGGAIDLRTKPLPEGRKGQIYVGMRATEGALGSEAFLSYSHAKGNFGDILGNGASDRPKSPSSDAQLRTQLADSKNAITGSSQNEPFGGRFGFNYEDRIELNSDKGRAFGYSLSYAYDLSYDTEEGRNSDVFGFSNEDYIKSEELVRQGGLVTLGYAFSTDHVLSLTGFVSRVAQDEVRRGFNQLDSGLIFDATTFAEFYDIIDNRPSDLPIFSLNNGISLGGSDSIVYKQRQLSDVKLGGAHDFKGNHDITLNWSAAHIQAEQEEPDTSVVPYGFNPPTGLYSISAGSPTRPLAFSWRDTQETTNAFRADLESKPDFGGDWSPKLATGVYIDRTERAYEETVFSILTPPIGGFQTSNSVSGLSNALASGAPTLGVTGGSSDGSGEREDDSVYVSGVFPIIVANDAGRALDLIAGVRFNQLSIASQGNGLFGNFSSQTFYQDVFGTLTTPSAAIDEKQFFPGLGLIYSPRKSTKIRLGYSETSARPSFREIGNYFTRDELSDDLLHGNANLTTSEVRNLDARFEYFLPNSTDLVAFSVFRKEIENPIERVALPFTSAGTTVVTWINNPNTAVLTGLEFEAAKNLGFISDFTKDFTLGGNYTRIEAKVQRSPFETTFFGGPTRRLFDQPESITNVYLTYASRRIGLTTTLSYFQISEVLQSAQAGTFDRYQDGYSRVDLTVTQEIGKNWRIRATASNLTDSTRRFVADPENDPNQQVLRTYKDGRSYTLTLTRDF